ncbi:hypothetical protein V6N12_019341 [Hibiscus sabdariffa]|uniref:Uncharacterized protein n=1 Tax=Hibiscus sabdariffa TaxID=183260 RepID=A0ABR2AR99_9ROSI
MVSTDAINSSENNDTVNGVNGVNNTQETPLVATDAMIATNVSNTSGAPRMLQSSQHMTQPQSQVIYASNPIPQHVLQSQSHVSNATLFNLVAVVPNMPYCSMSLVSQASFAQAQPQFATAGPAQLQPQVHLATTEIVEDNAW